MVAGSDRADIAGARTALFAGSRASAAVLANDGDVAAQILLAEADLTGRCVARDLAIAAGWLCKAAELESPSAQVLLAQFYKQGAGVEKDMVESAHRLEEAAMQRDGESPRSLGVRYIKDGGGRGPENGGYSDRKAGASG